MRLTENVNTFLHKVFLSCMFSFFFSRHLINFFFRVPKLIFFLLQMFGGFFLSTIKINLPLLLLFQIHNCRIILLLFVNYHLVSLTGRLSPPPHFLYVFLCCSFLCCLLCLPFISLKILFDNWLPAQCWMFITGVLWFLL